MTHTSLTAAVLVIGNEILSGRTQDTNSQWIADKMGERGIQITEIRVVPDQEEAIVRAVRELKGRVTYLFTTGGIGPTHDDITTDSVAKAFGLPVELNAEARALLLAHYEKNETQLTEARLRMARIPVSASLIENPVSSAPGFRIENVFVLAGVPRIMQAMLDHVCSSLESGPPILSNTIACSLAESEIAEDLSEIQRRYPEVEIGSYPHFRMGALDLSLVLKSALNDSLHTATMEVIDLIAKHGGLPRAMSIKSVPPLRG
ncbi:MAG: competence/damage-inducible protein A [Alphaproteobacteria bacterium]|jgi:molybdenum cofactor synthesis domain-containing protein|nr:competence/damage-inducible protein A [Alphaproteobacteria bacterium]